MREGFEDLLVPDFNLEYDFDESKFIKFLGKAKLDLDTLKEHSLYELGVGELIKESFILNNAGVLFFARQPQHFIKQAYLTCVRYQGSSMAGVIDRKDLTGDLLSLVDEAESFVKRHTRLAYKFEGFKRIDIQEYPYNAIREAIINAVCHRDYMLQNNIFVNVFDDRIEVISPGSIPNNLTIKQIYGHSNPRNFKIVELFKKTNYSEKLGSGLKRMNELMTNHGLKKPIYEANQAFFKVTFQGPKDKITELVKTTTETDLKELGLNERQIQVLNHLQKHKKITSSEYQTIIGTTEKTAQRDLKELTQKGLIQKKGTGKDTTYFLE